MARRATADAAASATDIRAKVAERAYFKAESRGFTPGHEVEDWLAAERELAAPVMATPTAAPVAKPRKPATRKKEAALPGAAVKKETKKNGVPAR